MNYSTLCAHRGLFWHVLKFNVHTAHTISHTARACKNSAGARSNTARVRIYTGNISYQVEALN